MTFLIGDRVACTNLDDFTPRERDLLEGRIGEITEINRWYYTVHFDEDITELITKNDIHFTVEELERV
jgi:hypothetical protein